MHHARIPLLSLILAALILAAGVAPLFASDDVPRTAAGRPDLTGTYDIATLTPLERPAQFGDNLYLSEEQAREIIESQREFVARRAEKSDPNRDAPGVGGAPPAGLDESQRGIAGAGDVGGYNNFWVDRGDSVVIVDGKFRTSIITDPANGRRPPISPEARARMGANRGGGGGGGFQRDDGTAYWLDWDRPGPYDHPESRPLSDRCIASFSSSVPALPSLYNNVKRIVQTEDHVMILNEMVHDARVVRLDSEHAPADMRFLLGDSIGRWEGDTLVVETTNFGSPSAGENTRANLRVVERFTRKDADGLHYEFTVHDPSRVAPYTGDFVWPATDGRLYEYACTEGNYALGNILRGARLLEQEAMKAKAQN